MNKIFWVACIVAFSVAGEARAVTVDQFTCNSVFIDKAGRETINNALISVPREASFPPEGADYNLISGHAHQDLGSSVGSSGKWNIKYALNYSFARKGTEAVARQYVCLSAFVTVEMNGAVISFRTYCPSREDEQDPFGAGSTWSEVPVDKRTNLPIFGVPINTLNVVPNEEGDPFQAARASCLFVRTLN